MSEPNVPEGQDRPPSAPPADPDKTAYQVGDSVLVELPPADSGPEAPTQVPVVRPSADDATLPPPTAAKIPKGMPRVPGYQFLRELGRGAMGVIYQARHV